jgi:transcriptional regulator with XRE-family HTH domain
MKLIQQVLREAPFSMRQLAEEAGVGYALVRAWRIGRRAPLPETLRDVAGALRKRGARLERLAEELDQEAGRE